MAWTSHLDSEATALGLVHLCRADDVTADDPLAVSVQGLPPLAVFRVEDDYFVTDNVCTHAYSLLTDGFQEDAVIECQVHGGTFDIRTGAATGFPCRKPLKTYDVVLADGWIAIATPSGEQG